jgi:hypothetical protein
MSAECVDRGTRYASSHAPVRCEQCRGMLVEILFDEPDDLSDLFRFVAAVATGITWSS